MPGWLEALWAGFLNIAATAAGRVLTALGFGTVTFTGTNMTLTWLRDQAVSAFQGLPADYIGLLSYLKVGTAISIIFSAILVRMVLTRLFVSATKVWSFGIGPQ